MGTGLFNAKNRGNNVTIFAKQLTASSDVGLGALVVLWNHRERFQRALRRRESEVPVLGGVHGKLNERFVGLLGCSDSVHPGSCLQRGCSSDVVYAPCDDDLEGVSVIAISKALDGSSRLVYSVLWVAYRSCCYNR